MVTVEISGKLPPGITARTIRDLAVATLKRVGQAGDFQASLSVVGEREMRRLNRERRGCDRVTDVLSFGYRANDRVRVGPAIALGDIVVCLPQVRRQANRIGRTVADEFALMSVHGFLHLLGFDHATPRQENRMFGLQQDLLIEFGTL